jgi:hypothetical protein
MSCEPRTPNILTKFVSSSLHLIAAIYSISRSITNGKPLTRGPGRLLPSDLAPILQYGSRPPSDFLAKILGVDTSQFLWNTRFYFTRSYL